MDNLGYLLLAYGIVWGAILLYTVRIKGKIRRLEREISGIQSELKEVNLE